MASADFDGVGRREGDPVTYRWPWRWHLPRLGLWLLLSLAIAVPRANQDRRALLIFLPTLALMFLWYPAGELLEMDPVAAEELGVIFESLVFGVALLWLNIDRIAQYPARVRVVVSLGILGLACLVAGMSRDGGLPRETSVLLLEAMCLGIVELAILSATRRLARRRCDPVRFMVRLGICGGLLSIVGIAAFDVVLALLEFIDADSCEVLATGLLMGFFLGPINMAYMVLMSASLFFRRRLVAWLCPKDAPRMHSPALLMFPET